MKKVLFISLIIVLFCGAVTSAQDQYGSGTIYPGTTGYVWGATTDSLLQSDTLQYTFRVRGGKVGDLNFALYVAKESGTVTSNFIFAGALMDSTSWYVDLDTIALSNASTGMSTDLVNLDDFNYPWLRVRSITGATAQEASYRLQYIYREE